MSARQEDDGSAASTGGVPLEAVRQLQQERDHLLLLHEALAEVERAPSMDARLHVFVEAIRRIGFGRVTITLRDEDMNATAIVSAGLSPEDEQLLRAEPVPGLVWKRRLAAIERFRISGSYYLEGRDPWIIEEFQGGIRSALPPSADLGWSPQDTLLVPLRLANGTLVATLVLDDPADRTRPTLTRVRTVELFAQQVAAMLEQASLVELAERRARRLQDLHEVGSLLARSLDEPTILRSLAAEIEAVLPVSAVVVLATDAGGVAWPRVYRRDGEATDEMFTPVVLRSLGESAAMKQQPVQQGNAFAVPSVIGQVTVGVVVVESANGQQLDCRRRRPPAHHRRAGRGGDQQRAPLRREPAAAAADGGARRRGARRGRIAAHRSRDAAHSSATPARCCARMVRPSRCCAATRWRSRRESASATPSLAAGCHSTAA